MDDGGRCGPCYAEIAPVISADLEPKKNMIQNIRSTLEGVVLPRWTSHPNNCHKADTQSMVIVLVCHLLTMVE